MLKRPKNEKEFQKREVVGVIRASRFVRKYSHSHRPINIKTVIEIHAKIFRDAWPDIAGVHRIENVKITDSRHLPPHISEIGGLMSKADKDLANKIESLANCEGVINDFDLGSEELYECIDKVITVAAWLHHLITYIHPFREGNGRTARLAANLILERYGLTGISVKIETENKNKYHAILAQIDKVKDYEPLKKLIYDGLTERYAGVQIKYYSDK